MMKIYDSVILFSIMNILYKVEIKWHFVLFNIHTTIICFLNILSLEITSSAFQFELIRDNATHRINIEAKLSLFVHDLI